MNPTLRLCQIVLLAAALAAPGRAESPAETQETLVPVAPPAAQAPAPAAAAAPTATPAQTPVPEPIPVPAAAALAGEISAFPPSPLAPGTTIVAVGSSTTFGLDFSYKTHSTYLEQFCRLPGVQGRVKVAENQGVSGGGLDSAVEHYATAWTDGAKVWHRPVEAYAPKRTGTPAWIFLWIGSNDFGLPNFDLPSYLAKYKAYIARAHADGFKVAIATLTPRGDNYNPLPVPDSAFLHDANRLALNRALSRLDPYYDGAACPDVVVRLDQVLNDAADQGSDPATRNLYGIGFLHPRQLGYYWVALAWYQALVLNGSPYTPSVALTSQPNDFRLPQTFQPVEMSCASGAGWYRVALFSATLARAQTPKHFHIAAYTDNNAARNSFELIVAGGDGLTGTLNHSLTVLNAKTTAGSSPLATQARASTDTAGHINLDLYLTQSGRIALTQDSDATVCFYTTFNPSPVNNASVMAIPRTGFASSGGIAGTAGGGDAAPGNVGEYLSATVAADHAVALANGAAAAVARLELSAGDWDVTGVADFHAANGAVPKYVQAGSSASAATLGGQDSYASDAGPVPQEVDAAKPIPTVRYSLNAPGTVYLVAKAGFPSGNLSAYGTLRARRVR